MDVLGEQHVALVGGELLDCLAHHHEVLWLVSSSHGLLPALTGGWWVAVFPGRGVLLAAATVNVIADRLRDHVDPRGRQIGVV